MHKAATRTILLLSLFFVAACAHNSYAPVLGGLGTQAHLKADLDECTSRILHQAARANAAGGTEVGAMMGGAVGGVIGAVADQQNFPPSQIDPAIERCMNRKGYVGHTEG